jgi:hypothetical protein
MMSVELTQILLGKKMKKIYVVTQILLGKKIKKIYVVNSVATNG